MTWSSFKSLVASKSSVSRFASVFSENAEFKFVPTGITGFASSFSQVVDWFVESSDLKTEENTVSLVETPERIVEEVVFAFAHEREIKWLLPGVRPTGRRLVVPLVFVVSLEQNLIKSVNVYWDQASLLKQIGVLPNSLYCKANASETVLPVQGVSIANGLWANNWTEEVQVVAAPVPQATPNRSATVSGILPGPVHVAQPVATPRSKTGVANIFSDEPVVVRPSTKVHQHPGGYSNNIFSAEPLPIKKMVDPSRYGSKVFSNEDFAAVTQPLRRDPNQTSFTELAADEDYKPAKKVWNGKATESHFSIAPAAEEETFEVHTGRKMGQYTNQTTFSFNDGSEVAPVKTSHHRNHNEQSQYVHNVRPSSRVLRPPGGGSSILIG